MAASSYAVAAPLINAWTALTSSHMWFSFALQHLLCAHRRLQANGRSHQGQKCAGSLCRFPYSLHFRKSIALIFRRIVQVIRVAAASMLPVFPQGVYARGATGIYVYMFYPLPALAGEFARHLSQALTILAVDRPVTGNPHINSRGYALPLEDC